MMVIYGAFYAGVMRVAARVASIYVLLQCSGQELLLLSVFDTDYAIG